MNQVLADAQDEGGEDMQDAEAAGGEGGEWFYGAGEDGESVTGPLTWRELARRAASGEQQPRHVNTPFSCSSPFI